MSTNTVELQYHGLMLSDYFQGTSGAIITVYVDCRTTYQEIFSVIDAEISLLWDHIEYTAEYNEFSGDLKSGIDEAIACLKRNVKDLTAIYDASLEWDYSEDDEDEQFYDEMPVLIFSLEFM